MVITYKKLHAIEKAERIYKEIAEDDKRLAKEFLSICEKPGAKYNSGRKTKKK